MTYLRINFKTVDQSVNLSPVVLRRLKGDRKIVLKQVLRLS